MQRHHIQWKANREKFMQESSGEFLDLRLEIGSAMVYLGAW
ncbi:hypothetical protein [Zavarzinella formosa]|nr:hypothetical protein [Zavarzinella formosa]